jgi:hypothetical protein
LEEEEARRWRVRGSLSQALDPPFEVLAGDEIDDVDGVGFETEEQAVVDADAGAQGVGALFEADNALEGVGLTGGEAAEQRQGATGDLFGETAERVVEFSGELDEPDGLAAADGTGQDKVVVVVLVIGGAAVGVGLVFAEGFHFVERGVQLAAEDGALVVAFLEFALEDGYFFAKVAQDFQIDGGGGGRCGLVRLTPISTGDEAA